MNNKQIHQQDNHFLRVLDAIPHGIYIVNKEYDVQYINSVIMREFGPVNEQKCYQYLHDRTEACPWCKNKEVFSGKSVRWEWYSEKNGTYYDLYDIPITNPDGTISKFEIFIDITSLKKAEKRATEERERLKVTLCSIGDGVIGTDLDGKIVLFNKIIEQLTGWSKENAIGRQVDQVVNVIDGKTGTPCANLVDKVLTTKKVVAGVNHTLISRDKTQYKIAESGAPIFNNESVMIGAVLALRDVTQEYKTQDALLKSKEEWKRTFDSIGDIITIQDKEFRIIRANQATCDFLGLDYDKIQGQFCYKLFHNSSMPCLDCPTLKTLADQKPYTAEMVYDHQQIKHNMLLSSSPIFDDQGECTGIVHSAKDITETRELENRLQQAQKMEAIGTMAGGIAHDFNNILTPILGYSEMLMESLPMGSQERADEAQVLKAANRAKELVKQILTFSRQSEHERNPVQIHLIIKEALKLMRSSMPANIEIKPQIAVDCSPVLVDPTQIHQVLMNLCTNSYHAMRDTGGILTVSLSEVDITSEDYAENLALKSGNYLKLLVRDTGHGMDKILVDKIFNPYCTTKKKGEGTGLGLAVVHGIVKSHHGQISVYSEPGQGTEVHVYLPCIETSIPASLTEQQEIPLGHQEKVLVVDDEESIVQLLGNMLRILNYVVITKSNSAAALETFRDEYKSIDLVVTDMSMPGMSGAELAVELLKIKPGLPIILCTGFSEVIDEEKAKAVGFRGFLLKPLLKGQVALAVREALQPA